MALDWSKEISFSGLRKRKPKPKADYPSKTYINLAIKDKKKIDVRSTLPKAVLIILLTVFVCKFGVFDLYSQVNQKEAELSQQTQRLSQLNAQLTNYDAVKAEYETYETTKLVADESTVSVTDAMALVDRYVSSAAQIDSVNIEGNTVTLSLSDISLNGVGKLVSTLNEQPIVANVSVSTAATDQSDRLTRTKATMVITLQVAS